jgi:hypothetical protein
MPEVQSDPELLLFASIAKADVDGELNAQDARDDWQRIEQLAKSQNNQRWANRALGERSFSEIYNMLSNRELTGVRHGRRLLLDIEDLQQWIVANKAA